MHFRPIRPPFVLCFAADQQGCGHHRISMPASALAAAGLIDARIDIRLWDESWLRAMRPDTVVFQRQIDAQQLDHIWLVRDTLPNAFLVYEIDDPLDCVPESSHHAGSVPPGVTDRIREALRICDAASTTTEPMAAWLRGLGATDVRVVPNLLSAEQIRERSGNRKSKRLRVGWAGGVSHAGDLALLVPAIRKIGRAVDWVFFGSKPDGDLGTEVEFHEAVPVTAFQDKLASLDLDLVVAPLEHNFFNDCKSNLRLLEAGACSAAVIAQAATPYTEGAPPVVSYVPEGGDWAAAIQQFVDMPMSTRRHHGAEMRRWVERSYTYEGQADRRLRAWMPAELPAFFRPAAPGRQDAGKVVVCCPGGPQTIRVPTDLQGPDTVVAERIEDAAANAIATGRDLLWLRPGTTLTADVWARIRQEAIQQNVATVCVLGPDGPDGFPTRDRFSPMPDVLSGQLSDVLAELWGGRTADVQVPSGAAILIRAPMLALLGSPDGIGLDHNTEAAITEWAIRASARQFRHVQVLDRYVGSLAAPQALTEQTATRMRLRGALSVLQDQKPQLSDREREDLELTLVSRQWAGPRPGTAPYGSDYATWSALRPERPIRMAQDVALAAFGGPVPDTEWVIWIDETVTLRPGAAAELIGAAGDAEVVYGDHELETPDGPTPVFKSDFDTELFLARDYVTPICAVRTSWLDGRSTRDRVDLYAAILHDVEHGDLRPAHVPLILGSVKPATSEVVAAETARRARLVAASNHNAAPHPTIPDAVQVRRAIQGPEPRVTIVIPTLGDGWVLQPCLLPLLRMTDYANYEVVVVQTGERAEPELGHAIDDHRVRTVRLEGPFNWSRINNFAAAETGGDYLLFLNDDTRVLSPEWLTTMVATADEPGVGVVGARLLHQQGTVQHVGVAVHRGLIGHVHFGLSPQSPGYNGVALLTHEAQAVTGACMLVSRDTFDEVGGFREDLSHNYNDVAFCLEVRRRGYRNVVECRAELIHLGGATRPGPTTPEGTERLLVENAIMGADYADPDPYWNPNFALVPNGLGVQGLGYEMLSWPPDGPEGRERVLVLNDTAKPDGEAARLARGGAVVLLAEADGFQIRMVAPALAAAAWDIRDPDRLHDALRTLRVDRVVLSSLVGRGVAAGVEMLRGLRGLGVPLEFRPRTAEVACPRLTLTQDGVPCGDGWQYGPAYCQACVGRYGSPFGQVDVTAWQTAWAEVLGVGEEPAADLPEITAEEFQRLLDAPPMVN